MALFKINGVRSVRLRGHAMHRLLTHAPVGMQRNSALWELQY
jgi:hypothetical protein